MPATGVEMLMYRSEELDSCAAYRFPQSAALHVHVRLGEMGFTTALEEIVGMLGLFTTLQAVPFQCSRTGPLIPAPHRPYIARRKSRDPEQAGDVAPSLTVKMQDQWGRVKHRVWSGNLNCGCVHLFDENSANDFLKEHLPRLHSMGIKMCARRFWMLTRAFRTSHVPLLSLGHQDGAR